MNRQVTYLLGKFLGGAGIALTGYTLKKLFGSEYKNSYTSVPARPPRNSRKEQPQWFKRS